MSASTSTIVIKKIVSSNVAVGVGGASTVTANWLLTMNESFGSLDQLIKLGSSLIITLFMSIWLAVQIWARISRVRMEKREHLWKLKQQNKHK